MPHCSYLSWIDFGGYKAVGDDPAGYLIENAKVAFSPGVRFGQQFASYVRLNFATSPEILEEAFNRAARALH
jgi:cystathionine beta-lyase